MANTACFIIVGRNDIPIYEAEVGSAPKVLFSYSSLSVSLSELYIYIYILIRGGIGSHIFKLVCTTLSVLRINIFRRINLIITVVLFSCSYEKFCYLLCLKFCLLLYTSLSLCSLRLAERRCCSVAPVYTTRCIRCRPRPCLDYKRHVCKLPSFLVVVMFKAYNSSHFFIYYLLFRFLKSVDRFNDLVVSVYVTAGHILFFPSPDSFI